LKNLSRIKRYVIFAAIALFALSLHSYAAISNSTNKLKYFYNNSCQLSFDKEFLVDFRTSQGYCCQNISTINDSTKSNLTLIPPENIYDQYKNVIKFTPLKIIGFNHPSIELSYERKTGKRFSTQLMASYLLPKFLLFLEPDDLSIFGGFRASVEERFYFEEFALMGSYVGLELNYLNKQRTHVMDFGWRTFDEQYYTDTFTIKKQFYSLNLKIGYQKIVNRFTIDAYVGLGIKYRNVEHLDRLNPNDPIATILPFIHLSYEERKHWSLSLPSNVRIGWLF
jgi:hypothetical protein